jgi:secreted trypsin-like serine protease
MKRTLLLASLTAALLVPAPLAFAASAPAQPSSTSGHAKLHTEIAGGSVGSVSGVVAVTTSGEYCTGSVVAPKIVLTAAHCLAGLTNASSIRVRLDDTNQTLGVTRYYRAPGFNSATHQNDAALLILKSPAKTAVLQVLKAEPTAGTGAMITGFGQHTYTSAATRLAYSAETTVQALASCQTIWAQYGSAVPSSDICAGNGAYKATLTRGDSGGPLLVKSSAGQWRIAGINDLVVIPNNVYNGAIPQAFGRVDTLRPWIEGKIAQLG